METNNDPDDYWAKAVSLFTGYAMPSRKGLFDKLKSKEGIPLFRMSITAHEMRAVNSTDYYQGSGWQTSEGEDYRLAFYSTKGTDARVTLYTADIVFIGVLLDSSGRGHLQDFGATRKGGELKGKFGDVWNDTDLWRYVSAPKVVLDQLVNEHTTKGFSYDGTSVADADSVDLRSFEHTAQSFDRAKTFFVDHHKVLEQWEKSLGDEQASWKGQAAGVFWNLIHNLNENYADYVDQFGGADYHAANTTIDGYTPKSKYGDMLAKAQRTLYDEVVKVRDAWDKWAGTGEHDPHRALMEELNDVAKWVLQNNVPYVTYTVNTTQATATGDNEDTFGTTETTYSVTSGFQENYLGLGNLDDINVWKAIGQRAVDKWNKYVEEMLVSAGRQSLSTLGNSWSDAAEEMDDPVRSKNTQSLTDIHEKEQIEKDKEELEKEKEEANEAAEDAKNSAKANQEKLNDNLSNIGDNFKSGFEGLGDEFKSGFEGLGDNFKSGFDGLGDNLRTTGALNTGDLLGGGGDLNTGGLNDDLLGGGDDLTTTDPLNSGLDDLTGSGGDHATTNPLNGPSLVPPHLPPFTSPPGTSHTSPLNGGLGLDGGPRLDDDGNLVTHFPDGSQTVFNPDTGDLIHTDPAGNSTTTHLNPGDVITNPDGSQTHLNPDGTLTTTFPDGTSQVFDPSDGSLQTTNPDGSHSSTDLNDLPHFSDTGNLNHLPHTGGTSGLNNLPHLGGSSGLNGGPHSSTSHLNGSLNDGPDLDDEFLDYDSTPYTGGALGGPVTDVGGTGGKPLNPGFPGGGAPMSPGMGGAGAGGGSNAERVRTVMGDTGGASLRRPGGAGAIMDGEDMALRRSGPATTSSGAPMGGAPMGGTQGGQSTESGERQRANWVEEEEDVWGTEEGGAPAVIG